MGLEKAGDSERNIGSKYVVITPVRNEAEFIERTIQSMLSQTIEPCEWIIANDGSSDGTREIIERYLATHPWIKLVNRKDRGFRQRGGGVVRAFYDGFEALTCQDYEFIVKLDGDLSFEPNYFEQLLAAFTTRPRLGIAGGSCYVRTGDGGVLEANDPHHVRGATKVYRRTCFEAIGGLVPSLGWDGIDEWKARMLGWEVRSFPDLKVLHYRPLGTGTGKLRSKIEMGRAAYFIGYHPLFMLARGIRRMADKPYVLGGLAMLWGYFGDWLKRREQVNDPAMIRFVRHNQLKRLGLVRVRPTEDRL
jgi:biofilm PGA synthesis N-glycosyltransferase PgaC